MSINFNLYAQIQLHPNQTPYQANQNQNKKTKNTAARGGPLSLPFFDDFSTSSGFPDTLLWEKAGGTFINQEFGQNVPSLKVATFDGIDQNGNPYDFSTVVNNAVGLSDQLSSCPINLSALNPANQLYLSFFWQHEGNGERPDEDDSLRIQFKSNTGEWITLWRVSGGFPTNSFTQVIIPVNESRYFHNAFQFRFQAFGRLSGLYDVWNVDYVYLNSSRNANDLFIRDLSTTQKPNSFLKRYRAMPVNQYFANPAAETASFFKGELNNLNNNFNFYAYKCILRDLASNTLIGELANTSPVLINANEKVPLNATIPATILNPTSNQLRLQCRFEVSTGDNNTTIPPIDLRRNDTIQNITVLGDYYAYDDGSAEYGAGINQRFGRVAVRYVLNKPDTLTDVSLHITKLEKDLTGQTFNLIIWKRLNNLKDSIFYKVNVPIRYATTRNDFLSVKAIKKSTDATFNFPIIAVRDTFYVGWEQTTNDRLTLGFDRNNDASSQIFFNTNSEWINWDAGDQEKGSLMIRPVFGTDFVTAGEEAIPQNNLKIYPNPTSGTLFFEGDLLELIELYDLNGRLIFKKQLNSSEKKLDIGTFKAGIYILKCIFGKNKVLFKRIMLIK